MYLNIVELHSFQLKIIDFDQVAIYSEKLDAI